jgi:RHS repeat-associated protein
MDDEGRCAMSATTSTTIARVMGASERVTAAITGWWSAIVQGTARRRDVGHPPLLRTAWALVALLALGLPSRADAQTAETPNFTIEYHHADLSGNIRLTTDEYGAVVREALHLPFGERDTGECGTLEDGARPLGYQGKPRDPKTCLDDFGARDYRAAIGRFQTVDPLLPVDRALRDPQQWNRYAYARNNPLTHTDPDGRSATLLGAGTGAAVGAAVAWWRGEDIRAGMVAGAVSGAIVGSVVDTGGGTLAVLAAGGFGGSAGRLIQDAMTGHQTTLGETAGAFAGGMAGAGFGMAVGKAMNTLPTSAARGGRTVIGKLDDIAPGRLRPGENNLLKHLEGDLGSPRANWARNSSVLRTEMKKGLPIRDASVDPATGQLLNNTRFLRAERNLLQNHGWTYNPATTMWSPPVP